MSSFLRSANRLRPTVSRAVARPSYAPAVATPFSRQLASSTQPFIKDEPSVPTLKCPIPGPESSKAIEKLSKVFDTRSLNMMADYRNSHGN